MQWYVQKKIQGQEKSYNTMNPPAYIPWKVSTIAYPILCLNAAQVKFPFHYNQKPRLHPSNWEQQQDSTGWSFRNLSASVRAWTGPIRHRTVRESHYVRRNLQLNRSFSVAFLPNSLNMHICIFLGLQWLADSTCHFWAQKIYSLRWLYEYIPWGSIDELSRVIVNCQIEGA